MRRCGHARCEAGKSHDLGLQVPCCVDNEVSVSRAVQYFKGKSSHKLLSEYQSLRKRYWGQHLWGRGYWVATSGNVTDEVWKKYIEDQKPEVPDDNFKVV